MYRSKVANLLKIIYDSLLLRSKQNIAENMTNIAGSYPIKKIPNLTSIDTAVKEAKH